MKRLMVVAMLALVGCDDGGDSNSKPKPRPASDAVTAWEIGPVNSQGHNYSIGTPLNPRRHAEGWSLPISPTAEPHYVTTRASLAGKTEIRMSYRAEAAIETIIHGKGCDVTSPSAVTIHFTSDPTNFSEDGHRWWATFATQPLQGAGEWEIVAPKDGAWTGAFTKTKATHPEEFAAAWNNAKRVGFTFANCTGYGHGARATGLVEFIVKKFEIL